MLGRIRRNAENVTINGTGIQGLTSVQVGYDSVAASPLSNLGINRIGYLPQGPQTASLQLNTLLTHTLSNSAPVTSSEVLENFTGAAAFSGVLGYGSKNIIFTEAYLQSYSVSCSIGEIPSISTSATIFGEFGTGSLGPVPADNFPSSVDIASYNSMEVNLDEFTTNRMLSFGVEITTPRLPLYAMGLDVPTGVIAGTPVEVNVNFTLDVDDYEIKNMRFVPEETVFKNTKITLNKNNSQTKLLEYSFDNMLLTAESFEASDESNAAVSFNLRSFILR